MLLSLYGNDKVPLVVSSGRDSPAPWRFYRLHLDQQPRYVEGRARAGSTRRLKKDRGSDHASEISQTLGWGSGRAHEPIGNAVG
jgi:hypothetical protein